MKQRTYILTSGWIFGLIAVLHLLRIAYTWDAMIGGWTVPMWLSWAALVVAGYLSYTAFRMAR